MKETATTPPQAGRIVGIDFGMARIGIAVSDERKIIATPLQVMKAQKRTENTASQLLSLLQEHARTHRYAIEEIVLGLPLLMSGKKGLLADEVTHFVDVMRTLCTIPIVTWDERLTSVQAERSLREGTMTRKKRTRFVDTVAATIILQSYLDHKKIKETQLAQPAGDSI